MSWNIFLAISQRNVLFSQNSISTSKNLSSWENLGKTDRKGVIDSCHGSPQKSPPFAADPGAAGASPVSRAQCTNTRVFFSTVKPTVIDVDIYVNSIGPVSSINMVRSDFFFLIRQTPIHFLLVFSLWVSVGNLLNWLTLGGSLCRWLRCW